MAGDESQTANGKSEEDDQEQEVVSRIVIEFMGPGMADIRQTRMENVSVGQLQVAARMMEYQADHGIFMLQQKREEERQRKEALGKIIVPRGVMQ